MEDKDITCDIFIKRYSKQIETGLGGIYYTDTDNLYVWGNNTKGQLGIDANANPNYPVKAYTDITEKITDIKSGYYHTLILTKDGKVYSSGQNTYGQLGIGTNTDKGEFTLISDLEDFKIVSYSNVDYNAKKDLPKIDEQILKQFSKLLSPLIVSNDDKSAEVKPVHPEKL